MKKIIYLTLIAGLCVFTTSCNDWLDVRPSTETKEKDFFKNEDGFKDALTGVYIEMKNEKAYGRNLTMTVMEHLAQHWTVSPNSNEEKLTQFNYGDRYVEDRFTDIYEQLYHTIVLNNNILVNIDSRKDVFTNGNYELIKGEALGIRAFLHFDLLRIFGPVPAHKAQSPQILPYNKTADRVVKERLDFDTYVGLLEEDIKEALKYLEQVDPVIKYKNTTTGSKKDPAFKPEDDFHYFRQSRMNYYAVKGLQARLALWAGKTGEAYQIATEIITSGKFPLATKTALVEGDYSLSGEQLIALNNFKLSATQELLFSGSTPLEKSKLNIESDLFEGVAFDMRKDLWKEYSINTLKKHVILKYDQEKFKTQSIPLLRISEIYLIAIEACNDPGKALMLFNEFLASRDVTALPALESQQERIKLIIKEYNKEFYAEGQMFYNYKRLNWEDMLWTTTKGSRSVFEIPLPQREVNFIP